MFNELKVEKKQSNEEQCYAEENGHKYVTFKMVEENRWLNDYKNEIFLYYETRNTEQACIDSHI